MSCSIWFSAPSFWMGGGLESRCVGRVCGADGAVRGTIRTAPCCIKLAFQIISQNIDIGPTHVANKTRMYRVYVLYLCGLYCQ